MATRLVILALCALHCYCAGEQADTLDVTSVDDSPLSYGNSVRNAQQSLTAANQALQMEIRNHASSAKPADYSPALEAQRQATAVLNKLKSMKQASNAADTGQQVFSDQVLKQVEERVVHDVEKVVERKAIDAVEAKVLAEMNPKGQPNKPVLEAKKNAKNNAQSVTREAQKEVAKVSNQVKAEVSKVGDTVKTLDSQGAPVNLVTKEYINSHVISESKTSAKVVADQAAVHKAMLDVENVEDRLGSPQ